MSVAYHPELEDSLLVRDVCHDAEGGLVMCAILNLAWFCLQGIIKKTQTSFI